MADRLTERLAALDPTLDDPPPDPGSDRFRLIQEKAMQTIPRTAAGGDVIDLERPPRTHARRPRRTRWLQYAAAAAVAVIATGVVVTGGGGQPAAAAVVREAVANLEDVDALRATLVQSYPDGEVWTFEGDFVGADSRQVGSIRTPDGTETSRWELIGIDDSVWTVSDGEVTHETLEGEERLAPFSSASAAVVAAALDGATDVVEIGREPIEQVEAVGYRIVPDDGSRAALAALAPGQLSWFALEDPAAVTAIEVWVTDDVVRRISVEFADGHFMSHSSATFRDFGAPLTIDPPG